MKICLAVTAALFVLLPAATQAASLSLGARLAGRILLQVQQHGEAWYVDPTDLRRTYMKDGAAAYTLMRGAGLGITDADLVRIPTADTVETMKSTEPTCASNALANRLRGRILLQVQQHGEAWYVDPTKCRAIYMKDGPAAYQLMRGLGLGITDADLAGITAAGAAPTPGEFQSYRLTTDRGQFDVLVLTLNRAKYRPETRVAQDADCADSCPAKPLADYAAAAGAAAGIHGSYFCPPDYADCAAKINSYLWPVFDSATGVMVNENNLKYHERPIVVVDSVGAPHLYRNAKTDFGWTLATYESATGSKVAAALGNYPALLQNGQNVVESEPTLDTNQRTARTNRGAWGWNGTDWIVAIAKQATVVDLAAVMQALGATDALNLDGGGSAALWYGGAYKIGPGRQLPNAVVFVPR